MKSHRLVTRGKVRPGDQRQYLGKKPAVWRSAFRFVGHDVQDYPDYRFRRPVRPPPPWAALREGKEPAAAGRFSGRMNPNPKAPPSSPPDAPPQPPAGSNLAKDPSEWTTGNEPMTGAQRSYLKTLSDEAREPFDDNLTKAEASQRIDELQKKTGRGQGPQSGPTHTPVPPREGR